MLKLGILGGTFDPPHIGHLILAQEAWYELNLDRVLFVPAREPPLKEARECAPIESRLAMVQLAIRDNPVFELSQADADRPGPNYSVDLVKLLREQYPPDTEFYFIMGLDSLVNLPKWSRPQELVRLCKLAVMNRPGVEVDWPALEQTIPGIRARVVELPRARLELASSELQARAREHRPLRYLIPEPVLRYIREHELYTD